MTSTEYLTQDGLSEYDLEKLTEIIRGGHGDWYHAHLMRALHMLLPQADHVNTARLEQAYPGSVEAYRIWYNDPTVEGRARPLARPAS
jgi:hypothetical protein